MALSPLGCCHPERSEGSAFDALLFDFEFPKFLGDYTGGVTPVPIPNTAVKPSKAHGTALVTMWESRSLPGLKQAGWSNPARFAFGVDVQWTR